MSKNNSFTKEEIIRMAAKAGADAAIASMEQAQKREVKDRRDRRLRNAKLLLKEYRNFKECAANAIYAAEQAEDDIDILELMWGPNNRSEQIVESIRKSAIRTKVMVAHIEAMLSAYKTLAYNASDPVEKRRYDILLDRYIADNELSPEEIKEKHNIAIRTVFMDIEAATERFSKIVFGVDAIMHI